jgi:hypothetical protein
MTIGAGGAGVHAVLHSGLVGVAVDVGYWPQAAIGGCLLFRRCQRISRRSECGPKMTRVTRSRPQDGCTIATNLSRIGCIAPEIEELRTVGRVTEPSRGLKDERQSSRVRRTRISVHRARPLFGST